MIDLNQHAPILEINLPSFRFKFYFRFLQSVNREVAREVSKYSRILFMVMIQICNNVFQVRDEYVDTMGKIMFSYFKSYTGRLDRCLAVFSSIKS